MAIVKRNLLDTDTIIGVWEMTENYDELFEQYAPNPADQKLLSEFKKETRKKDWLASRLLLKKLVVELDPLLKESNLKCLTNDDGGVYFENSPFRFSLSHSFNMAAAIIKKSGKVGVDIELIHPRINRIAHKFIPENQLNNMEEKNKIEIMYVHWCGKEALFKLYGKGKLDYRENLKLNFFNYNEKGKIRASIVKGNFNRNFDLYYETINHHMLAYVIGD